MSRRLPPISRKDFIKRLRRFGWEGPYHGPKHMIMERPENDGVLVIPNPHRTDIPVHLLSKLLKEACISREDWIDAG